MGLSDVAGVLSRKFIVGFFIPAFFGLFALSRLVAESSLPAAYRDAGETTQIIVIGGAALLFGLLLSGLHYSLLRFLEGYWLSSAMVPKPSSHAVLAAFLGARRRVAQLMIGHWVRRRRHLQSICAAREADQSVLNRAAAELQRRFPAHEDNTLPTRFGNAVRAFETHPRRRYGLDGIAVWPRIASMLTESERKDLDEATTDLAFWVNALVVILVGGIVVFLERLWHPPGGLVSTFALEAAIAAATSLAAAFVYWQAIAAAVRWGDPVRAAFDVHRLQLYDVLGMQRPSTAAEDGVSGEAVNRLLHFAEPIPDALRSHAAP
jgi:hypothetical protein